VPHTENTTIADQKSTTSGVFVQYDLRIEKLKIGIGGRFDHYEITDYVSASGNKDGNVFSPRINLMYEIVKPLQARLSYSQGYRAPQIYNEDLHIEVSGSRKVISINDPALKQEESHSFMASLDFNKLIGTINTGLLAEAFFTRLSNPFVNEIGVPDEDGTVYYTRKNAENGASVQGVNFEFKMKPLIDLSLNAGFTIQKSLYDEAQQFNEKRFFRTPSDYGFIVAEWDFLKNFCLSGSMTYTGRMLIPYYGPLTDPDTGDLRESDRFVDMGCKLAHTIKLDGVSLQWFAGIKNIFNSYQSDFDTGINRDPSYIYGPILPRTIYLGLRFGNQIID
jgi:outer membrane receptor for ferrienterochelin and colicins